MPARSSAPSRARSLRPLLALVAGLLAVLAGVVVVPSLTSPASADGTNATFPTDRDTTTTCDGSTNSTSPLRFSGGKVVQTGTTTNKGNACRFAAGWADVAFGAGTSRFGQIYGQTLFSVYATRGQYIEVGSDQVATSSGDVVIWNPETSTAAGTTLSGLSTVGAPQASGATDAAQVTALTNGANVYRPGGLTDAQIHNVKDITTYPANSQTKGNYDSDGQPDATKAAGFSCVTQRSVLTTKSALGQITSRGAETAGPQSIDGASNTGGYVPCYYKAPVTGLYHVAMVAGGGIKAVGTSVSAPTLATVKNSSSTSSTAWTMAWDITVRGTSGQADSANRSDASVGTNNANDGRVFTYNLAANTGGNKRPLAGAIYTLTLDGFLYKLDLAGADPNNGLIYGNQTGFLTPDSTPDDMVPLNHDVRGSAYTVNAVVGDAQFAPPAYPMFFTRPDPTAVGAIWSDQNSDHSIQRIPTSGGQIAPQAPAISDLSFVGSINGAVGGTSDNTDGYRPGGSVTFTMNEPSIYQVVVSRDGTHFDPGDPQNAVLQKAVTWTDDEDASKPGIQVTVDWHGNAGIDDIGGPFPKGNYKVRVGLQSGVYHFPLLDVEGSWNGGPTYQLLNPPNGKTYESGGNCGYGDTYGTDDPVVAAGKGCFTAFYDDRGYDISSTTSVGTPGGDICGDTSVASVGYDHFGLMSLNSSDFSDFTPADITANINAGSGFVPASDSVYGYDSSSNQREWGVTGATKVNNTTESLNNNADCGAAQYFGDAKGIDAWTSYPSTTDQATRATLISPAKEPNDTYSTGLNTTKSVTVSAAPGNQNLLGNDGIDDRPDLRVVSVSGSGATTALTSAGATVTTDHGSVTVHPDGTFSYTPADGFYTDPSNLTAHPYDTFAYVSDDGSGIGENDATVQIYVSPGPSLHTTVDSLTIDGGSHQADGQAGGDPAGFPTDTDKVKATYTVTNTGDSTVSNVAVDSVIGNSAGSSWQCTITTDAGTINTTTSTDPANMHQHLADTVDLAPGATATFACTGYTVSSADIAAGEIDETATAGGTAYDGTTSTPVTSPAATDVLLIKPRVHLDITHQVTRGSTVLSATDQVNPGDVITFTYAATNTGSVSLDEVALSGLVVADGSLQYDDPVAGAWASWSDYLQANPGKSGLDGVAKQTTVLFRDTHTVTKQDIVAAGQATPVDAITEHATVTGDDGAGNEDADGHPIQATDSTQDAVAVTPSAALSITPITGTMVGSPKPGDTLTLHYRVTNTGNVDVTGVSLAPTVGTGVTCAFPTDQDGDAITTLAVGDSVDCTASHTLSSGEINSGSVTETATTMGIAPGAGSATTLGTGTAPISVAAFAQLTVDNVDGSLSTAAGASPKVGDTIAYTYKLENTGGITLNTLAVTSAHAGVTVSCPVTTLESGASTTCTSSYALTAADITAGTVDETGTATATPADGGAKVTDSKAKQVVLSAPSATITSDDVTLGGGTTHEGDTATATYTVHNTGNVPVTAITLTAKAAGLDCAEIDDTNPAPSSLAAGATWTFACTFPVTQDDIDAGTVSAPTLTVSWTYGGASHDIVPAPLAQTTIAQVAQLVATAAFTTVPSGTVHTGDALELAYTVANEGNVAVSAMSLHSALLDADVADCDDTALAPGAETDCTASYALTLADVNRGTLDETAVATGTWDATKTVTSPDAKAQQATLSVAPQLSLDLSQQYSSGTTSKAGDTIDYTYTVTNTGDVTISGVQLTGLVQAVGTGKTPHTSDSSTLVPGAHATYTATHTVTAGDITARSVTEKAQATGSYAGQSDPVLSDADPAVVGDQLASITQTLVVPEIQVVATKTGPTTEHGSDPSAVDAGDTIAYTYTVTNTGDEPLSAPVLSGLPTGCTVTLDPAGALAAGASATGACTYTLTQDDLDNGSVASTPHVTAGYQPPAGGGSTPPAVQVTDDDSLPTVLTQSAGLSVVSTLTPPTTAAQTGDEVTLSYRVTNTGNVRVHGITASSSLTHGSASCDTTTLAPHAHTDCTATYTLTQDDVDAGTVTDTATAGGLKPDGTTSVGDTDPDRHAALVVAPALSLALTQSYDQKSAASYAVGDTITYTYTATNTGDVRLSGVTLAGLSQAVGADAPQVYTGTLPLEIGASVVFTATHTITAADITAARVVETAQATGTYATDGHDYDATGTPAQAGSTTVATVTQSLAMPALTASISTASTSLTGTAAGQTVAFAYDVKNTGNVAVSGVALSALAPAGCTSTGSATLAVGASLATPVTCTHTFTQADVDAGTLTAAVTATGTYGGRDVTDSATLAVTLAATPALTVTPSATTVNSHGAELTTDLPTTADTERFRYLVENTGPVTILGVSVTPSGNDPLKTVSGDKTTVDLGPGASATFGSDVPVTQDDINAGAISQSVAASGSPKQGSLAAVPATASNSLVRSSGIDLALSGSLTDVNGDNVPDNGDTIDFVYTLTNTGNTTLHDVKIDDDAHGLKLDPTDPNGPTQLLPSATLTLRASKPVTPADVAGVSVTEKATAVATAPSGTAGAVTSAERSVEVNLAAPALGAAVAGTLTDANHDGKVDAGDSVTWTYTASNTGNVALSSVQIGGGTLPSLARGASGVVTAVQSVTQADMDRGLVSVSAQAKTTFGDKPVASTVVPARVALPSAAGLSVAVGLTADPGSDNLIDAGDAVTITYTVTNSGTATVSGAGVVPTLGSGIVAPADTTIAPGGSRTWRGTYALSDADMKAGSIVENASASAHPVTGAPDVSASGSATMSLYLSSVTVVLVNVSIESSSAQDSVDNGDWIVYTYEVTNTGNVPMTGIQATSTTGETSDPVDLAPGASVTITLKHKISDGDVAAGGYTNTTTLVGHTPGGTVTSAPVSVHTKLPLPVKLTLTATLVTANDATVVKPGDVVRVIYLVHNAGGMRVSHVTVTSDLAGIAGVADINARRVVGRRVAGSVPDFSRAALDNVELRVDGEATFVTEPYTVTQQDLARGRIVTAAVARGMQASVMTTVASNVAQVDVRVHARAKKADGAPVAQLPDTGLPTGTWQVALLGGLMIAGGSLLIRTSRRRLTGRHRS